ncbi:MAG: hypothetical protein ACRERV_01275 [Methylococcales bacterium]
MSRPEYCKTHESLCDKGIYAFELPTTRVKIPIHREHWDFPYSKKEAFFPNDHLQDDKYWPPVARADNVAGHHNLGCTCPPLSDYME